MLGVVPFPPLDLYACRLDESLSSNVCFAISYSLLLSNEFLCCSIGLSDLVLSSTICSLIFSYSLYFHSLHFTILLTQSYSFDNFFASQPLNTSRLIHQPNTHYAQPYHPLHSLHPHFPIPSPTPSPNPTPKTPTPTLK